MGNRSFSLVIPAYAGIQ